MSFLVVLVGVEGPRGQGRAILKACAWPMASCSISRELSEHLITKQKVWEYYQAAFLGKTGKGSECSKASLVSILLLFFFPDFSIDAPPPSFKPAKKYSDVSGLLVSISTPLCHTTLNRKEISLYPLFVDRGE